MATHETAIDKPAQVGDRLNRTMYRFTGILGLTTGVGVIAWGAWSLVTSIATFIYLETGVSMEEILINSALNEDLLLSAVVIALGVIILELKKIQHLMRPDDRHIDADAD